MYTWRVAYYIEGIDEKIQGLKNPVFPCFLWWAMKELNLQPCD